MRARTEINIRLYLPETKHAASSSAPTTTDPRKHPTPPSEVTPPPVVTTPTAESAQAALLALLTSAATAKGTTVSQTVTNTLNQASATPPQQPQLEQIQLALLHQLSKNTSVGAGTGSNVPPSQAPIVSLIPPPFIPNHPPPTIPQQNFNYPGPSSRSPPNTESYKVPERRDPRASKFDDAPVGAAGSGRGRGAYYDDRRGGPQSGPLPSREEFRGRGHNNIRGGGRYGGRERDYESSAWESQERKSDWGPPSRRRSSRSRSPPSRAVGNPNGRQYSPPRRHSHASPVDLSRPKPPGASDAGKDEFGRDIRPTSEEPGEVTTLESVRVETRESSRATDETPDISRQQQLPPPTGGDTLSTTNKFNLAQSKGLESFDITTFDPTNAASWKALGDAFQVSNGYMPSQEELMQLVMSSMGMMMAMGAAGAMGGVPVGSDNEDALPAGKEHTIGVQDWGTDTYGGKSYGQGSDAVILGQDGGSPKSNNASQYQDSEDGGSGGLGGKMQKVGDRWMFVRDGA
ncbi:hypothetical protein EW145_g6532 [Phellinidium pouzarii]|uniref:Uncharacterized protein n=1 Tax=Phellinidium pouzarii TaxID=167371 RepID=A0A4S4KW97_9AGAM|nr:hypothetical protein EW145_g6532 [Phellinidium pouzarii]